MANIAVTTVQDVTLAVVAAMNATVRMVDAPRGARRGLFVRYALGVCAVARVWAASVFSIVARVWTASVFSITAKIRAASGFGIAAKVRTASGFGIAAKVRAASGFSIAAKIRSAAVLSVMFYVSAFIFLSHV